MNYKVLTDFLQEMTTVVEGGPMCAKNELPERSKTLDNPLGENSSADLRKSTFRILLVSETVSRGWGWDVGRHEGATLPEENSCRAQPVLTAAAHIFFSTV